MRLTARLLAATVIFVAAAYAAAQEQPPPAAAQPELEALLGQQVRLTLTNGEVVRGELTGLKDGSVLIAHPVYGDIALARQSVTGAAVDESPNVAVAVEQPSPVPPATEETAPPTPDSFFEGWSGSIELGLNGSEGNTERVNLRTGISGIRKTSEIETSFNFTYVWAREDRDDTENRARFDVRNDWLLGDDTPWRAFLKGSFEYDEFQNWDTRASVFAGLGYEFIDNDKTFLLGRVGAGITREFGGDENAIMPEGLLGLDFRHALTERQQILATAEFLPDLADIGHYRAVGRATYEVLIDPEVNMKLKVGVEDRYDSDPGTGFKRNDFDYFALLAWEF